VAAVDPQPRIGSCQSRTRPPGECIHKRAQPLHGSTAVICLLVSTGVGIQVFFLMIRFMAGLEVNEFVATLLVSMAWVALLVIWILAFLLIMFALDAMQIKDVRAVARNRLSNLELDLEQLHELREFPASRDRKHGGIFRSVVADLSKM